MKYYYPAIFFSGEKIAFVVKVPDLPGCVTQGYNLQDATNQAVDAIGTWLDGVDAKNYPAASKISDIDVSEYENAFVNIVEFDAEKYYQNLKAHQSD